MPRGVPLTPEQIAEATRVYLATGNYSEAARAIGSDVSNVRRQLIAAEEPTRAMLHTQALARAVRDARRSLVKVRRKLDTTVDVVDDVKDLATVAAQIHDNARATVQMQTAHAKLMGEHAPDKHEHTIGTDDDLTSKLARLVAAHGAGEDPG
jgi:hypothetical protein